MASKVPSHMVYTLTLTTDCTALHNPFTHLPNLTRDKKLTKQPQKPRGFSSQFSNPIPSLAIPNLAIFSRKLSKGPGAFIVPIIEL